jgi:hypothetical protein
MIPVYTFTQRDAADRFAPKNFTDLLISTSRFLRDQHQRVQFKLDDGSWLLIDRKQTLKEILLTGDVVRVEGDLDDNAVDCWWLWLAARRGFFPRMNPQLPCEPIKPKPQYGAIPAHLVRRS